MYPPPGQFAPEFFLLQREGYLFRACLINGLNSLRWATASDPGRFYSAFFDLSIGIERTLKSIIVVDMLARGEATTNHKLRHYSHDLNALFNKVSELRGARNETGIHPLAVFGSDSIERDLIAFLSDFAIRTRYFNLDALSSPQTVVDPLVKWGELLKRLVRENVSASRARRIVEESNALASILEDSTFVMRHDLDGTQMDLEAMLATPRLQELGCRYAVYHVIRIIDGLREAISNVMYRAIQREAGHAPAIVPHMYEFLDFAYANRTYVLRKKRWP